MATIPTPRSFQVILGEMIDAYLSKLGIPSLPVGDPILTMFEAAAQSDLRTSQDIFQLLNSISLDRATGVALSRIGADENLEKFPEFPSSGLVTITDSSFEKVQSSIYQGTAAPIIGSSTINVADATDWPSSGDIYIGRGTNQYEGPLAYTSLVDNTSYWTINLDAGNYTQKFHNLGETVILAQGGDRLISAGTLAQTPQGTGDSVQFSVLYSATIPDGEIEVTGVTVVARNPGVIGNIPANSITAFVSAPFVGATITNPTPYTNGKAAETDKDFRERIRNARATRAKATPLAIKTAVTGVTSTEENKRVISASVVAREGYPTTCYIDDGTGYEEKTQGISFETIVESALGGEQYFSLANGRPVTKAFAVSQFTAPFTLSSGAKLAATVGGTVYEHTFSVDEFRAIESASAYEVVASINGNPDVAFSARTASNGTKVAIFADDDINEDIEVTAPVSGINANDTIGFPVGRNDTLRLYKNDRLLNKDGALASLLSNSQGQWSSMGSGETLQIKVDGVDISGISNTYTISDSDFVNAGTAYTSVASTNTLESWAQVLNYKIPGITVTEGSGYLTVTSNRGRDSEASVQILGGTLTAKGMFDIDLSTGSTKDYTLNRNLGQIRLESALAAGDKLTAGSLNTRAFIESGVVATSTLATDGELWFCVDGDATIVPTGVQAGNTVTYSVLSAEPWGDVVKAEIASGPFANVAVGDWLIVNDPALGTTNAGAFRIKAKTSTYVLIERQSAYTATGATVLTKGGFYVVRSSTIPQRITVPAAANYTALTFVDSLNTQLLGATAEVYKTNKIRVKTNRIDTQGDIALVAVNTEGEKLELPVGDAVDNLTSHLASVITSNEQAGTPSFAYHTITATGSTSQITGATFNTINTGNLIVATAPRADAGPVNRFSNDGFISTIVDDTGGTTLNLRKSVLQHWLPDAPGDLIYEAAPYALNAYDKLVTLIDNDVLTKRYSCNLYRNVSPTSATYGATNDFEDADNNGLSLAVGFGVDFDWKDFSVWMKARTKTHLTAGVNTTKTILYRYYRYGPEGNVARLQYRYPSIASQTTTVVTDATTTAGSSNLKVILPSGAARTGQTIRAGTRIGIAATSVTASLYSYYYVVGFNIDSGQRTANVTTITLGLPGPVTDHGLQIGDQIYINSTSGSFSSGVKVITARSATTVDYAETAANVGATANIGTTSFDTSGIATLAGSTIVAGDIWGVQTGTGLTGPSSSRIFTLDVNGRYWQTTSDQSAAVTTVLTWYPVNDLTKISWFPVNSATNTATLITSAVNALTGSPVSAVAVGGGAGVIEYATYEATPNGEGAANPWYALTDGINYVKTHSTPGSTAVDFNFTFKQAITATLVADSDWGNEDVRLVPLSAKNIVDYLNSTATSGLSSVAEVILSDDGQKPQISSYTPGSEGSIQIQGGSANSLASTAKNSAVVVDTTASLVTFPTSDLDGLSGKMWVDLENSTVVPKAGRITASTSLTSVDANGNFVLNTTNAWDWATSVTGIVGGAGGASWQFVKQGRYMQARCLSTTFTGLEEGDIAIIKASVGTSANDGTFRVIRQYNDEWFWFENANGEEGFTTAAVVFLDYDSILPTDTLSINTTLWGSGNVGSFIVESIDLPSTTVPVAPFNGTGSRLKFKVQSTTMEATAGPIALGASSSLVQVIEGAPSKLLKQVVAITPNSSDSTATDVKFNSAQGYLKMGSFAGTILKPVDKLAFGVDIATGIDGYTHSTGLLAEANSVLYGVESDPSTYPGIVAAGAKVNIEGPLIKRIEVALAVRVKTGISTEDIFDKVQSEVAAVVNNTAIGSSISISDIVKAAQGVNGVIAVSILSPVYDVANDLITVQPFEKPLILNVDTDVLVSLVGE